MPDIFNYLIKLSVGLSVVYLFYRFVLRPLTFYTWNRWFLLAYSAIAFVIPFININSMLADGKLANNQVVHLIPVIDPNLFAQKGWFNFSDHRVWLILVVLVGITVMLLRLALQFWSYTRLKSGAKLIASEPVNLYQVDKDIVPFSFGNAIFINSQQHTEAEMQEIIRHEFIHVKQKHTADMMWAELLCIFNWYNPFAWLIKKVICQNLEFIADQQVLQNGVDKKEYQYLLLKVAGGASYRITNQFNFSFLKKRILMMNKTGSARVNLVRFVFIFPLLAVLLLSFRENIEELIESPVTQVSAGGIEPRGKTPGLDASRMQVTAAITVRAGSNGQDTVPLKLKEVNVLGAKDVMYIVDDIVRDRSFIEQLKGEDIASIDVLKGERTLQYGEKGKNGVIRIFTKLPRERFKNPAPKVEGVTSLKLRAAEESDRQQNIVIEADTIRIDASLNKVIGYDKPATAIPVQRWPDPLFIVDGVALTGKAQLSELDPNSIESMEVLKDGSALKFYGTAAAGGVILITTKKSKPPVLKLRLKQDTTRTDFPID